MALPQKTKICFRCKDSKPVSEFWKNGPRLYHPNCKVCARADARRHHERKKLDPSYVARKRIHSRNYYAANPQKDSLRIRRFRTENPNLVRERDRAARQSYQSKVRRTFANAVAAGKIKRSPRCEDCHLKSKSLDGHHEDYSKPFDVIWLCKGCHGMRHRKMDKVAELIKRKALEGEP